MPQVAASLETGTNGVSCISGLFGGRGSGHRKAMMVRYGGTKHTEQAVTAAMIWLVNHQMNDGHWSLNYKERCDDKTCTGARRNCR